MPVIEVGGLIGVNGVIEDELIDDLTRAVARVKGLDVDEDQVWVFINTFLKQKHPGKNAFVEVKELFIKPERTTEVRQRLVESLHNTLVIFASKNPKNPIERVAVFVNELDRDRGGYFCKPVRFFADEFEKE